jgi:hypothetical protein
MLWELRKAFFELGLSVAAEGRSFDLHQDASLTVAATQPFCG